MKKVSFIFAMLAMVFALTFTACRNSGETEATEEATEQPATEEAQPAEAAPAEGTDAQQATESTEGTQQQ